MDVEAEIGALEAGQRDGLLQWLDAGLRRGIRGRLEAEYPLSLGASSDEDHRIARIRGRLASHAMVHEVEAQVGDAALRVGMIGLVYSDPDFRGRGLAASCVRSCIDLLRSRGVGIVLLWSDLDAFYRRLGFAPAGSESMLVVDAGICRAASDGSSHPVTGLRGPDALRVERLLHERSSRVHRAPGSLLRLAAAPDTQVAVAWQGGVPVAYAAHGRGDDFQGVVHEWAGTRSGVIACIASFCAAGSAVGVLAGPERHPAIDALERAGASSHGGPLAWVRILDAAGVARAAFGDDPVLADLRFEQAGDLVELAGSSTRVRISAAAFAALLLDGRIDAELEAALADDERFALRARVPWPLYLWGFDSI